MSLKLPSFREERLLYSRSAGKVRQASSYVTKLPYFFTIPIFSLANTWRGSSEIIRKYSYSFEKNFSILDFLPTSDGNYIPCLSWKDENDEVVRMKLWYHEEGLLYVPDYDGRTINKNFYLEIWNTNNELIEGGGTNLKISQFKIPTTLCEEGEIALNPSYNICSDMSFNIVNFDPLSGDYYAVINTCLDTQQIFGADIVEIGIDELSNINNIILNIEEPDNIPDLYEIYKSVNGGAFNLLDTILAAGVYNDTSGMPVDSTWCYKVRAKTGIIYSPFSDIKCVTRDIIIPSASVVDYSTLVIAFSDLGLDDPTLVVELNLSNLKLVVGTLGLDGCLILETIDLSKLHIINGMFRIEGSTELVELDFPDLVTVGGDFHTDGCTSLTTINFPNFVFSDGKTYAFDQCALSVTSVNHILARAVASGVIACEIFLDGGTNAIPTGQGLLDKVTLIAAGNVVTTN